MADSRESHETALDRDAYPCDNGTREGIMFLLALLALGCGVGTSDIRDTGVPIDTDVADTDSPTDTDTPEETDQPDTDQPETDTPTRTTPTPPWTRTCRTPT